MHVKNVQRSSAGESGRREGACKGEPVYLDTNTVSSLYVETEFCEVMHEQTLNISI